MGTTGLAVRITHPFHPLLGQIFEVVSRSPHWGEDRVIYRAANGTLPTIAVALTDMAPPDPFRRIAAGRAAFRIVDLQRLLGILEQVSSSIEVGDA
ncbi:Y4bD/Y4pK family protein [Mesorhizobium sp. L-2-11]|uniref:Y4bD/Y4pK family protein n=1 Tax=Mesorhizobium sp. L-2-11 TaxID=2744521 RepID=UPI0018ECEB30|nr:Y4bD/Y4pK family protein [Mesorhizobium sp. L-2-11]BCH19122.1 hypothetical protein MesoLjLa_59730 [Mesorhizobium sp. L-2-11]BCH19853.1 hypothetical protein MesoLjLa_67040 [Mesorhizobium sp. L-2-11]